MCFFFVVGGDDGCGHLASDTQASEFGSDLQSKWFPRPVPPQAPRWPPPHPSQLQQMSAGNVEARVSENPDSSEYLGMRSPGLHKRLLGVLWRSSWVYFSWPSQLCIHLWLIHVSKCRLSQQALRILNRHQHLLCVAIRHRGRWLRGQLECKASHQDGSSSPHQMSLSCAEVTDHTLSVFTLIAFQ